MSRAQRKARRRATRRRSFRFTREGKVFVSVTLGVGLAAVNTGNNLLYLVLGLMLSLLLVSGALSDVALWKLRFRRRLPRRLFAGAPALVELAVTNGKGRLPSYALEVREVFADPLPDPEEAAPPRAFFLKIEPASTAHATYRWTPPRRGRHGLRGLQILTRYPFGLIEKGRFLPAEAELVVYPARTPVDVRSVLGASPGDRAAPRRLGHGGEVTGLREYRDGDDARAIHWRRSAALDRLVVRERAADVNARLAILLDDAEPAHASDADRALWRAAFEVAVSEAASLAEAALALEAAVEVRTRARASPLALPGAPPDAIWRWLALLETVPADGAPPLEAPRGGLVHRVAVVRQGEDEGEGEAA